MRYLVSNAAAERLGWILDGLSGQQGWGGNAADVMAPEFAEAVPPGRFADAYRQRAAALAPVSVVGLEVSENGAKARVRGRGGDTYVVYCEVEAEPPHRITAARMAGLVPAGLTPRLPMDFSRYPLASQTAGARLIVFSGLPGSGKSTLADTAGSRLGIPVFAADWLLGSLTPFGGYHLDGLLDIGAELLTALALRQLELGQSAVLDYPAEDPAIRARWRSLAERAGADFKVVVCHCPDAEVHRGRLESRKRGIPGWHEAGNWANVQRRLAAFPPWTGPVLTVDTTEPQAATLARILDYCRGPDGPPP